MSRGRRFRNIQQQVSTQRKTTETKMVRLHLPVCLSLIFVASALASELSPRGARPVEHGTRGDKCATQRDWPFCTSDNWGPKCPSGCRILGLMDKFDHGLLKNVEKIRSLLDSKKKAFDNTNVVSKQTYDYVKEQLIDEAGNSRKFSNLAHEVRQKIINMKLVIDRQRKLLDSLRDRVKDQVAEMQKLEVDIDIKLRACKGSCQAYTLHQVDHDSYVELDKQVKQLDAMSGQSHGPGGQFYVIQSQPFSVYSSIHKTTQQAFDEVQTLKLVEVIDGSSSSPANVSKGQGTSMSSSSSSSSTSSSSSSSSSSTSSSSSITELGGGSSLGTGFGHTSHSSTTFTCTKSTKKTIVHTKDGPVEKVEEVIEGGPHCQGLTDSTMGTLDFPDVFHTSSSSSSSSSSVSKTVHSNTKGSLLGDSKTGFDDPFGLDFGVFATDDAEDDHPDFQARSVKSARVERHADYVGKDCVDAHQKHLKGETNGLFKIKPGGADSTQVVEAYCQQEGLMGGWLLVQQRDSGALSFNRTWAEYRDGFGSVDAKGRGEFWLGNQNLHLLTNQGETMLKVELEDWEGGVASAEYSIRVGSEAEGYPLHVSAYMGDAGDAFLVPNSDMASYLSHNGMKFSTFDKDNDKWEENCAEMFGGGWWYNNCQSANLNGIYYKGVYDPEKNTLYEVENGVVWTTYKPANYSLKAVRMFIRAAAF